MSEQTILDTPLQLTFKRRRELLPWWIRLFSWVFMIFGGFAAVMPVVGLIMGIHFNVELFGLASHSALTPVGVLVTLLFVFNGFAGYGLWTEAEWGVRIAKLCALVNILTCCVSMALLPALGYASFNVRLELIPLIFFWRKLDDINDEWNKHEKQL